MAQKDIDAIQTTKALSPKIREAVGNVVTEATTPTNWQESVIKKLTIFNDTTEEYQVRQSLEQEVSAVRDGKAPPPEWDSVTKRLTDEVLLLQGLNGDVSPKVAASLGTLVGGQEKAETLLRNIKRDDIAIDVAVRDDNKPALEKQFDIYGADYKALSASIKNTIDADIRSVANPKPLDTPKVSPPNAGTISR